MPTPGELNRVAKAVADLLARDGNEDLTADELAMEVAEEIVSLYEEQQAKAYNTIVLGHFRLDDDTSYVAAVGPLSTRAVARAREVGERFAWDYKTRRGTGKFTVVPLLRNPNEAWDAIRSPALKPPQEVQEAFAEAGGLAYYATPDPYGRGGTCICGIKSERERLFVCPRHPEGRDSGTEGPAHSGTTGAG